MDVKEEEADALLRGLPPPAESQQPSSEARDAFNHILVVGDRRIPFSPEEAPEEFKPTIERLVAMLKVDPAANK
jgi:hypothetical protein